MDPSTTDSCTRNPRWSIWSLGQERPTLKDASLQYSSKVCLFTSLDNVESVSIDFSFSVFSGMVFLQLSIMTNFQVRSFFALTASWGGSSSSGASSSPVACKQASA